MRRLLIAVGTIAISTSMTFAMESSVPFINADDVHDQGVAGLGITVAVIDTGIYYDHEGLAGSIAPGGISIIYGGEIYDGGADIYGYGHGTYMSLIITDGLGVAPNARILPIRVFGSSGVAFTQDVIDTIDYVRNRRVDDPSIRVINLSLGGGAHTCPCDDWNPGEAQAISDARLAGIVTFAATGNEAICGGINAPACVSSAVKVAANYDQQYTTRDYYWYDEQGQQHHLCSDVMPPAYWVTCFSNIAEECEFLMAAPGYDIRVGGFGDDGYHYGTSQATAHCSGVAALMFDKSGACGSLSADVARSKIFNNATEYWWAYPHCSLPPPPRHVNALAAVNDVTAGSCSTLPGDMDCDETFSSSDFDHFTVCMTGPGSGGSIGGGCACADFPQSPPDGDVDMADFMYFQRAFTGGGSSTATVTLDLTSPSAGQNVEPGETVYWSVTATVSQGDNAGLAAVSVDLVQDAGNQVHFDVPPAAAVGAGMEGFNPEAGIANPPTGSTGSAYGGTPSGPDGSKNLWQIGGAQNTFGEEGHVGMGTDFTVDSGVGQSGQQVIAEGSFSAPIAAGTYVFRIENGLANVLDLEDPPPSPPEPWPVSSANVTLNTSELTFVVTHDAISIFDFDADSDVDQVDFGMIQRCYTGYMTLAAVCGCGTPENPCSTNICYNNCKPFDLNGDDYVKNEDVILLGQCVSGPTVPASALCGDCNGNQILDVLETEAELGESPVDGILVLGRAKCTSGNTVDCDDNCPCVYNPDQADTDGDGMGDVCDATPDGPLGGGEDMDEQKGDDDEEKTIEEEKEEEPESPPLDSGGNATYTLDSSGNSEITIAPGDSFTVNIGISYDADAVAGFDVGMTASTDNVFAMTARTVHLSNFGPSKADGIVLAEANKWLLGTPTGDQNLGGVNSLDEWTAKPLSCMTITIDTDSDGPNAIASGDYTLSLTGPGMAGLTVIEGSPDYDYATVGDAPTFVVHVSP